MTGNKNINNSKKKQDDAKTKIFGRNGYELPDHYARYLSERAKIKTKEHEAWKKRLKGYQNPDAIANDAKPIVTGVLADLLDGARKRKAKVDAKGYRMAIDENDISCIDPNFMTTEQKLKTLKYIKAHPHDPIVKRLVEEKLGGSMQAFIASAKMKQQKMLSNDKGAASTPLERYASNLKKDKHSAAYQAKQKIKKRIRESKANELEKK